MKGLDINQVKARLTLPGLDRWLPEVQMRWRQGRRQFDARLPNERRLLIIAVLAAVWFVFDTFMITPAFEQLKAARSREQQAVTGRDALQNEINRKRIELANRLLAAEKERELVRKRLADGEQELAKQQSMMAPAREMQALLEGLLVQNGQLKLKSMRTLPPTEVKFQPPAGMENATPVLFSHGLEVSVSGGYLDLVAWLRSLEQLPRRLLWDGMTLSANEDAQLLLTLEVHTFSPDRDTLEIAP